MEAGQGRPSRNASPREKQRKSVPALAGTRRLPFMLVPADVKESVTCSGGFAEGESPVNFEGEKT